MMIGSILIFQIKTMCGSRVWRSVSEVSWRPLQREHGRDLVWALAKRSSWSLLMF